jgi:leucyl-tRNA synthetase
VLLQVNGKLRGTIEVSKQITQEDAEASARSVAAIAKFLDGKPLKKVIFVPGRILNFIVGK